MKYRIPIVVLILALTLASIWFTPSDWRLQDNCLDAGGKWNADVGKCRGISPRDYFLLGTEVTDFLSRVTLCNHWAGEAPSSATRAADIETNINELRCSELAEQKTKLDTTSTPYQRDLIENYLRQNQLSIP